MSNKTSITASIDLTDEFEIGLLKHVQSKSNKSQYIKRLIYLDTIAGKEMTITTHREQEAGDRDAMLDFI